MLILSIVFALLIGLSLGLLGGGGSILTVPVLVYALGFEAKLAITMSLPIVGVTAAFGAWRHWRLGNVQLERALLFGGVAMVGAYAGGRGARWLDARVQLAILGIVMAASAVSMLRSAARDRANEPEPHVHPLLFYTVGLGVGALTGIIGIGGGFLIVPALVVLGGVAMRQAVGTSLLVIAMNCVAGYAGQASRDVVDWRFVTYFTAVSMVGLLAGTAMHRFTGQTALKRGFAVFLFLIALLVLWNNRSLL
ncbi:MAG: sulfite exporter TauE/SafE family protein [Proteobacteria bacterium]|nr:sulfite exporter TauE/SafE family protein [Pseudomonadota bacterium]